MSAASAEKPKVVRSVSTYDGRTFVGDLLELDDGTFGSVDINGRRHGPFATMAEARGALSKARPEVQP